MKSKPFEVTIDGMYIIILPETIVLPFIEKGHSRPQFKASHASNEILFHGALRKRNDHYLLMFSKAKQQELKLEKGEPFTLQLFEDTTEYGVIPPEELEEVLNSDPFAFEIFKKLTDGKKRSIIYYIKRIKNSQTRIDKSLIITENLKRGITELKELYKLE
ncbi:YdeI/OmpD-associated family protein [Jejudonia soesokkakensis]|uniref:YdeI/OmpD-associated family protein n=1 Tax=Jejudonia soesokkakensis TaxID=1323432 RepID=A0ABW2MSG8_9FLAO